jgi:pimeloyl-ACP methyl ester carboxylesterase
MVYPRGVSSTEPPALKPPSRLALLGEARIAVEWATMRLAMPRLVKRAPRGDGGPVLVAPGFATDDAWTGSLRRFLGAIGWDARGWGLGRNSGRVPELIPALVERVAAFADEAGAPARLVGWSLGGYLVREVARERPDIVVRVITLGAPIVGGPKYTASAPMYVSRGYDLDKIEAGVEERERDPIRVPVDAVYSRSDGVVAWRSCIDRRNPMVRHHEVGSSHLGLVASPAVFHRVAELLGGAHDGS